MCVYRKAGLSVLEVGGGRAGPAPPPSSHVPSLGILTLAIRWPGCLPAPSWSGPGLQGSRPPTPGSGEVPRLPSSSGAGPWLAGRAASGGPLGASGVCTGGRAAGGPTLPHAICLASQQPDRSPIPPGSHMPATASGSRCDPEGGGDPLMGGSPWTRREGPGREARWAATSSAWGSSGGGDSSWVGAVG